VLAARHPKIHDKTIYAACTEIHNICCVYRNNLLMINNYLFIIFLIFAIPKCFSKHNKIILYQSNTTVLLLHKK